MFLLLYFLSHIYIFNYLKLSIKLKQIYKKNLIKNVNLTQKFKNKKLFHYTVGQNQYCQLDHIILSSSKRSDSDF